MVSTEEADHGFCVEHLRSLTFFATEFEYQNERYDYTDVAHVEFTATATKKSINFVPVGTDYNTNLSLHLDDGQKLHIAQEYAFRSQKQKDRSEAVMRAASIFMQLTFDQRIEAYEQQIRAKKFVCWGHHQIATNGDLFRRNVFLYNLLQDAVVCTLGPFEMHSRTSKPSTGEKLKALWSGPYETVNISVDKDCFLYFMKHYVGLSWKDQQIPRKRATASTIFNDAILRLGAKLCKADGHISSEEISQFKVYFGIDEQSHPGAGRVFSEAAKTTKDFRDVAANIFALLEVQQQTLEYILVGLMKIAAADGVIDHQEDTFIRAVATEFRFSRSDVDQLFFLFEAAEKPTSGNKTKSRPQSSPHIQKLEILGLSGQPTLREIKIAYRSLARKHHPDMLRAQGVPIDNIQHAEEILKTINSAYEWLLKNYVDTTNSIKSH